MPAKNLKRNFFLRIILPTLLAFIMFTISFFTFIIPSFEENLLRSKREMITELTNSAWSILKDFNSEYEAGSMTLEKAKKEGIAVIKNLRYGEENKDYFWITDEYPTMVMHPYRPELDSTDLSEYSDPSGKKLFVEFVKVVKNDGRGYVDYMWQWKDDSTRIVPKLSFVKEFRPWGWIIGTGIYIEDVKDEIARLTGNLIYVSLGILFLVGLSLFYIGRQSFKIEHERQDAEEGLRESESKYRALVEASTDGLIMILEGEIVYANNALLDILGYEFFPGSDYLKNILCEKEFDGVEGKGFFNDLLENGTYIPKFETKIVAKSFEEIDVILYTSEITLGERSGFTIIVKDIGANKRKEEIFGENQARFNSLINNINIGIFRSEPGKDGKFIEVNSAGLKIFGFENREELFESGLSDLFMKSEEKKAFFDQLTEKEHLNNNIIQLRKKDGSTSVVSISAIISPENSGMERYCDGIVEDITERIKLDEEKENLIVELQTSLKFLHQPLEHFLKHIVACNMNIPVHQAAKIITKHKYSAALVMTDNGEYIGIVTDHDLRKRVVAENLDMNQPVYSIMSAPLITIRHNSLVFEALIKMNDYATRHLAVKNSEGKITGIISSEELLKVERQSSAYLLREIEIADSPEDLTDVKIKLPWLIKTLVDSGARAKNISHIITSVFDAIVLKLINFAISDLGDPPAKFAFMALGSAGRKEQTLISDQDNAIIFENIPENDFELVKEYFDKLAEKICFGLNECGYFYCKGEAMAKNPKWTQPLDKWAEYFHNWIAKSDQQDLIDISIYFDFRHVYGDISLVEDLRTRLAAFTNGQAGFFQHLTKNCLLHKPPVGIMGGLLLESKGEHPETFDIKMATMPISDFARIYSLKHNLSETNTLERFRTLFKKGIINKNSYEEIVQAYNFLMQLRFRHQATQITLKRDFDNHINPKELTQIEIKTLKNTFSQITGMQKRLSYDFSGEAI